MGRPAYSKEGAGAQPYCASVPMVVPADDVDARRQAVRLLRAGQAVVVPTDTVYGIAVRPTAPGATDLVFAVKGRPSDVPLALLAASIDQVPDLAELPEPGTGVRRLIERLWPGPLTVVLPRAAGGRHLDLGGDGRTIGVRCPDHELVRALATELGPLAVTSANRHGEPTPATAAEVGAALPGVALVLDGGSRAGLPSTVVDGTDPSLPVLRQGAIPASDIHAAARP
jgi:L-threonylcarbamoyladenylate synthase